MAVVQQGCESLIPAGPLNDHSSRQLGDALIEAEHWKLALDVHLKWGFATTGVMVAHGLACLRAGCYDSGQQVKLPSSTIALNPLLFCST